MARHLDDRSRRSPAQTHQNRASSFDDVVHRYHRLVAAAVRRVLGPSGDVDDVIQETWIAYLRSGHQVLDQAALGGWLFRVSTRLAVRARQRNSRSEPHPDVDLLGDVCQATDTTAVILWSQRRVVVAQVCGALNERERQVVALLLDDDDLCYREISDRLGMPIGSIGPTRDRVIRKLQSMPSVVRLTDNADRVVAQLAQQAS